MSQSDSSEDSEAEVPREHDVQLDAVVQVAEYVVLQEIGTGMQGTVYRAQNKVSGETHAIKELTCLENGITPQARTEIAVMKRLRHPNVARFIAAYDTPLNPNTLFLVLEFVEGGSLYTDKEVYVGGQTPLPLERVRDICQQLVRGISYLHYMGVMHRDIKPSNILGNRYQGIVKVSDFGVSSFTKRQKSARLLGEDDIIFVGSCGTPAFLPPEASGAGIDQFYHARPADVWALGVTFYFLMQGNLPFKGESSMQTAQLICEAPVRFVSKLSSQPKDLISKMLEKNALKRPTLFTVQSHHFIGLETWKVEAEDAAFDKITAIDFMTSVSSTKNIVRRRRSFRFLNGMRNVVTNRIRRSISNNSWKSSHSEEGFPSLAVKPKPEESTNMDTSLKNSKSMASLLSDALVTPNPVTANSQPPVVLQEGIGKRLFLNCVTNL